MFRKYALHSSAVSKVLYPTVFDPAMAFDSEESTTPNTTGDIRPFCRVSDAIELRYVSIYVMYIPDPPTCIANALETSKRERA